MKHTVIQREIKGRIVCRMLQKSGGCSLAICDPGLVVAPALQVLKIDPAKHVGGRGYIHYSGRPAQQILLLSLLVLSLYNIII